MLSDFYIVKKEEIKRGQELKQGHYFSPYKYFPFSFSNFILFQNLRNISG